MQDKTCIQRNSHSKIDCKGMAYLYSNISCLFTKLETYYNCECLSYFSYFIFRRFCAFKYMQYVPSTLNSEACRTREESAELKVTQTCFLAQLIAHFVRVDFTYSCRTYATFSRPSNMLSAELISKSNYS